MPYAVRRTTPLRTGAARQEPAESNQHPTIVLQPGVGALDDANEESGYAEEACGLLRVGRCRRHDDAHALAASQASLRNRAAKQGCASSGERQELLDGPAMASDVDRTGQGCRSLPQRRRCSDIPDAYATRPRQ